MNFCQVSIILGTPTFFYLGNIILTTLLLHSIKPEYIKTKQLLKAGNKLISFRERTVNVFLPQKILHKITCSLLWVWNIVFSISGAKETDTVKIIQTLYLAQDRKQKTEKINSSATSTITLLVTTYDRAVLKWRSKVIMQLH